MQAAAAVDYMHSQGVVHRDLTSYNLLVTDKWECKLADFNLSRAITDTQIPHSGQLNSPEWSAPERLSGQVRARTIARHAKLSLRELSLHASSIPLQDLLFGNIQAITCHCPLSLCPVTVPVRHWAVLRHA